MNGEIPSVPITTLAGVSSLTDLLPEMPLPSPLPQTLSNKSLLFHPRVAEEAQILLSHPNESLIPQLVHSLSQTTSEHIELKDQYAGTEQPLEHQADAPELLKAILLRNASVFKGPARNQQWKQQPQPPQQAGGHNVNSQFSQSSPASYGQSSPGYNNRLPAQGSQQGEDLPVPPNNSLIPQRASVIADPQRGLDQTCGYNDISDSNKLNPGQALQDWDRGQQKRKSENEHFNADNVSQRVGVLHPDVQDYSRPEVHPSHRGTEATHQFPQGDFQPVGSNNDLVNSIRNFRPQKTHGQSSQEPYNNSLDQRLLPTLQSGSSPAQASVAPEENVNLHQKYSKKDSTLLDSSGTSTSVQKDPTSSESEYTPRSDTSSGVSSGGSSSVVTLGSNDSLLSCTPTLEGSDKLVPVLNFQTGEIEYKPEGTDKIGNKTNQESYDKFKRKVLQRNSSVVNNGIGEPLGDSTKDNFTEMQKNMKPPSSVKRSDSVSSNGSPSMIKPAFVRLNRLSEKDQALMQKSIKEFAQQQPSLANKLGISSQNHRKTKPSIVESDSGEEDDDEVKKPASRIFKSRDRDKSAKKKKDSNYVPPSFQDNDDRSRKRRRSANHDDSRELSPVELPKPKVRKVERKMVPVLEKLSVEELMETNTYQRFNTTIDRIFENTDDLDLTIELDDTEDVPPEALIPKYQLQDLCAEAAKLKTLGAMESIPTTRLVKLLNILEKNIRDGARVSPIADPDDDEEESKLWLELAMERVMRAMDASLTAIYILTSPNMPKRVYLEDVIDRIVLFTKFQLTNTIYPSFDPVYRIHKKGKDGFPGSARKKRSQGHQVREKSILTLYTKLHGLVGLLAELLNIQILTDTAVLHASSMAVSPFFVEEVSELQLSALKLVTTIFTKYEKHRRLLLDDILASIARLPSSKRSLRTYRLNSEEHIQMLTALVLQLIQCVVILPENLKSKDKPKDKDQDKDKETKDSETAAKDKINMDRDVLIINKYETSMKIAGNFLSVFLSKCGSKTEEIDYRPLFENFVQDLLTTVNKPEWPAAEVLLSLLGKLLVSNFMNKGTDMALRVASLDYLGVVAARLRKDYVTSHRKLASIDQMIAEIKAAESKDNEIDKIKKTEDLDPEEERTQFLQRVLLDYLAVNGQSDAAWSCARHFYLAQWYHDCMTSKSKQSHTPSKSSNKKNRKKKRKSESSEDEISEPSEHEDEDDLLVSEANTAERFKVMEARKQFLLSKIKPFSDDSGRTNILQTYIDYTSADLISRFLASKRPFSLSFDGYLQQILRVLAETSIAIRTKAIKCLTMVVEADPSVLGMKSMQMGVRVSFLDHATSVREAAVDLVGKFVLSRPELIDKYYDMLSARILDTGVSVRKRVIKILRDICIECPEFPKIPEICVKMIRRVNDEEGIRKLVMEVFQNMWFTPVKDRPQLDHRALLRKVMNITEVVATSSKDMGLEWFEQLLVSLFKPKEDKDDSTKIIVEPPKALITACTQIVDCLIENVLKLEEQGMGKENQGSSQRLVACLTTLYLFAKIRPQLLVNHAITLQPYLSLKCQTQGDYQIVSNVARTLELIVPLMEHPSETFLAQLEEDSVKLILQHDRIVVASCLSCLGSIVNNVTKNYKLIRDCFQKYYGYLIKIREHMEKDITKAQLEAVRPACKRALFTVGLLMRHFDFTEKEVRDGLPEDIKDQVFSTLFFFVHDPSPDIQHYTMIAIGSLCIRHYEFMLGKDLKQLYYKLLTDHDAPLALRAQVLHNVESYLQEEEYRMIKQDQEWSKLSKQENLKEMGDVSSGMASTVIQLYIKEILDAFLHHDVSVRKAALKVIQLILQQGLVHPVQIVPYLICMSTDVEKAVSHSADKQLQEIEKKYPGFIHMKAQLGIKLSYRLQRIMQGNEIVRGFRHVEGESIPGALNGFLYSILRTTKQQRRAIALSVLKQFDEQVKTSLAQMLYLADNLAYFPYQVQDEPLFIVHHIDVMISMSGTNLLQSFREALIPPANQTTRIDPNTGQVEVIYDEDEDEDEESLLNRVPEDTTVLQECITASQGCLLLLVLKQHLKDLYGLSDAKIAQYSPSESAKIYEKAVNRKSNSNFNPKATLSKLKEGDPPSILNEQQRKTLIDQYLDFKQLMLKYDPDEEDEDAPQQQQTPHTPHHGSGNSTLATPDSTPQGGLKVTYNLSNTNTPSGYQEAYVSPANVTPNPAERGNFPYTAQQDTRDVQPGKIPKLTIVTPRPPEKDSLRSHRHKSHKSDKQKKHRHKKRKKYSDDESEDNEFSDPDFLV